MLNGRSLSVSREALKNYWNYCTLENRALIVEDLKKELGKTAANFNFDKVLLQKFDELPKPVARMVESRILNTLFGMQAKL